MMVSCTLFVHVCKHIEYSVVKCATVITKGVFVIASMHCFAEFISAHDGYVVGALNVNRVRATSCVGQLTCDAKRRESIDIDTH